MDTNVLIAAALALVVGVVIGRILPKKAAPTGTLGAEAPRSKSETP